MPLTFGYHPKKRVLKIDKASFAPALQVLKPLIELFGKYRYNIVMEQTKRRYFCNKFFTSTQLLIHHSFATTGFIPIAP